MDDDYIPILYLKVYVKYIFQICHYQKHLHKCQDYQHLDSA